MNDHDYIEGVARPVVPVGITPAPVTAAPVSSPAPVAILDADNPRQYLDRLKEISSVLVEFIRDRHLVKKIGDKEHVYLEGWQFLGSQPWIRCYAVIEWTREILDDANKPFGWEARALVYRDGFVIGAGDAMCLRFIVVAAGYSGTSAEDMPGTSEKPEEKPTPAKPIESAEQTEARRNKGIRDIHIWCANRGIDTKEPDGMYLFVLRDTFPQLFNDKSDDEVTSKILSLEQLQLFSRTLQAFHARIKRSEEEANG
jgi:hypothetical protein